MRQSAKVEGTKIAQAAKDLKVTSVTIRRYISEFNIDTMTDENGIKVLPETAMDELKQIRELKEEGHTNPKVMEILEERRAKPKPEKETKPRATKKTTTATKAAEPVKVSRVKEEAPKQQEAPPPPEPAKADKKKVVRRGKPVVEEVVESDEDETPAIEAAKGPIASEIPDSEGQADAESSEAGEGRAKHSLTCQTCGKVFEHMNPRLRDCLECYRAKRKERRRGGAERHKNVIQHPLAQQLVNKAQQAAHQPQTQPTVVERAVQPQAPVNHTSSLTMPAVPMQRTAVRNYRKAIEETRQITSSLKRRLMCDLQEGERRWLEQIYAYQLILHQGWRHLAEYKAGTHAQHKEED